MTKRNRWLSRMTAAAHAHAGRIPTARAMRAARAEDRRAGLAAIAG